MHTQRLGGRQEPRSGDPRPRFRQHNIAEGLVSLIEPPLKKLQNSRRFLWSSSQQGSLKVTEIQDVPISWSQSSWLNSLNLFRLLQSLEIQVETLSSSLLILLSSFSLKFLWIGEFLWSPEFGDLRSLPSLYEDGVNNGRSNDSVSPDREEDNHVSSGNNEGRLDDHSGSNDVSARLISVPDGGGIEEPERRAGETPRSSTVIAVARINGVESFVESVIEQWLRHQDVNLDSLKTIFENFNVKDLLTTDPLFNTVLTQKTNNVRMDLSRMLETNSELSSEELKEYYPPICWNSTKRLEFFVGLSDRLLLKAMPNRQDQLKVLLLKELESKKPLIFNGTWSKDIDPNFRADGGKSSQCRYNYKSVVDLLRFIRNNWLHRLELPEEFKLKFTGHGGEKRFYDYFDERFPNFLMKSYRVASRFCREEKFRKEETWFENFC